MRAWKRAGENTGNACPTSRSWEQRQIAACCFSIGYNDFRNLPSFSNRSFKIIAAPLRSF